MDYVLVGGEYHQERGVMHVPAAKAEALSSQ